MGTGSNRLVISVEISCPATVTLSLVLLFSDVASTTINYFLMEVPYSLNGVISVNTPQDGSNGDFLFYVAGFTFNQNVSINASLASNLTLEFNASSPVQTGLIVVSLSDCPGFSSRL